MRIDKERKKSNQKKERKTRNGTNGRNGLQLEEKLGPAYRS